MDLKAVERAVARIQTSLFKNSNSYSIGMLKSKFRGQGLQFKEHQIYMPGDDVRFIDWKLLAKTNTPYIKTFNEERNVEIVVVIDASPTMLQGHDDVSKLQASIEIACLLYLIAKETNDYVHTIVLADEVINFPKKNGEEGIVYFISELERRNILTKDGRVNIKYRPRQALNERDSNIALMKHLRKKREIVILSDFNTFKGMETISKLLRENHVYCYQVLGPLDETVYFPYLVYAADGSRSGKNSMTTVHMKEDKNFKKKMGKNFKRLRVDERYLEDFIKELI